MKKISILIIALFVLAMFTACNAGSDSSMYNQAPGYEPTPAPAGATPDETLYMAVYDDSAEYEYDMVSGVGEMSEGGNYPDISLTDPYRKLIREANLDVETLEFDESVKNIENLCASVQGFIQNSSVRGTSITIRGKQFRMASYTFRIPKGFYDQFINMMGNIGNVVNKSMNSIDVTDSYYDIESRVKILELRRDRLYALLEKETSSRSIVEFEESLSQTLYELDRLKGSLRHYDSLVDYSTVYVTLEEVEEYTEINPFSPAPKTAWERISSAFGDSLENVGKFFVNLFVFLVGNIIYILILLAVATVIFICIKRLRPNLKKKEKKNDGNSEGDPK